jgi:predicted nucleic acid-binding protein
LVIYLDTSAFVKLVWTEPESDALRRFLAGRPATPLVSSAVLTVETRRAVQREDPSALARADLLLTRIGRIGMTASLVRIGESVSRPLAAFMDAIHLAAALLLRDDLDVIVTYDKRLAAVAEAHQLPVASPNVAAND